MKTCDIESVYQKKAIEFTKYIAKAFVEKYFTDDDGSCAEIEVLHPLGCVWIADYFFSVNDMLTALDKDVSREDLLDWYDYSTELYSAHSDGKKKDQPIINLINWHNGLRPTK